MSAKYILQLNIYKVGPPSVKDIKQFTKKLKILRISYVTL